MIITIKVDDYEKQIPLSDLDERLFEVDFDGTLLLLIEKTENGLKIINGVNGHGQNVRKEFEDKIVVIY